MATATTETLGEKIRRLRERVGLSQRQFAEAIGKKSTSSVADIEAERSRFYADDLILICKALEVSADELLGFERIDSWDKGYQAGLQEGRREALATPVAIEGIDGDTLGERIREHRILRGWTRQQLAAVIGRHPGSIRNAEQNKGFSVHDLALYARAFGVTADELLGIGVSEEYDAIWEQAYNVGWREAIEAIGEAARTLAKPRRKLPS